LSNVLFLCISILKSQISLLLMHYDKSKYKIWTWKNPLMLHWIINPGLAVNELLLGQRIPKVTLIEKNTGKSVSESTIIPCPHCGTMHSGLKWSAKNHTAFRNWFGLYCDNCGKIIPCLTNLTSYLILGLTFPFWIWFKDKWKAKWLEAQKEKFSKPLDLKQPEFKWWYVGLRWGFFMYIFMTLLFPLIIGEDITRVNLLRGIPIWGIAGLAFGFLEKKLLTGVKIKM
jgi:hypothetical protein